MIQLARRFGIVTPYTSYLVTENQNQVADNRNEDEERTRFQPPSTTVLRGGNVPVAGFRRPAPTTPAAPPRVMPSQPRDRSVDDLMGRVATNRAPARPAMEVPAPAAMPMGDSAAAPDFSAFQSLGGGAPGATGSGSSAGPSAMHHGSIATPAPVVQAAPPPPARPAVEATGEAGRRVASTLRAMREAQTANTGAGNTRFIAGRSLVLRDGIWIEEGITGTPRELHVRALSRSYFTLVRLRPELRELLAIGREVRFRLDASRVIVVGASQPDTADAEIEAFLR